MQQDVESLNRDLRRIVYLGDLRDIAVKLGQISAEIIANAHATPLNVFAGYGLACYILDYINTLYFNGYSVAQMGFPARIQIRGFTRTFTSALPDPGNDICREVNTLAKQIGLDPKHLYVDTSSVTSNLCPVTGWALTPMQVLYLPMQMFANSLLSGLLQREITNEQRFLLAKQLALIKFNAPIALSATKLVSMTVLSYLLYASEASVTERLARATLAQVCSEIIISKLQHLFGYWADKEALRVAPEYSGFLDLSTPNVNFFMHPSQQARIRALNLPGAESYTLQGWLLCLSEKERKHLADTIANHPIQRYYNRLLKVSRAVPYFPAYFLQEYGLMSMLLSVITGINVWVLLNASDTVMPIYSSLFIAYVVTAATCLKYFSFQAVEKLQPLLKTYYNFEISLVNVLSNEHPLQMFVTQLAHEMQLTTPPQVVLKNGAEPAMVSTAAFGIPGIMTLPSNIDSGSVNNQLEFVIRHELAHEQQRDVLWGMAVRVSVLSISAFIIRSLANDYSYLQLVLLGIALQCLGYLIELPHRRMCEARADAIAIKSAGDQKQILIEAAQTFFSTQQRAHREFRDQPPAKAADHFANLLIDNNGNNYGDIVHPTYGARKAAIAEMT